MGSGVSNIVSGIAVFLTGLLPAGCHHQAAPATPAPATNNIASVVVTNPNLHDLGELTLTNHNETRLQFSGGNDCVLLPEMTDSKNASLTLTFETRTPDGKLQGLNVKQVIVQSGQPAQVAFDEVQLNFTPKIVSQSESVEK